MNEPQPLTDESRSTFGQEQINETHDYHRIITQLSNAV